MIRKNISRPLYREILGDALVMAWRERRLWILALFAGALQTGGIYDVLLASIAQLPGQVKGFFAVTPWYQFSQTQGFLSGTSFAERTINTLSLAQGVLFAICITVAVLGFSLIAQGALAYGLGGRTRVKGATFRQCLTVGARNFWPILTLNIFTLSLIWLARFFLLIPFAYSVAAPSYLSVGTYFLAFVLFILASILFTTIHLFALNAIILEQKSVWGAIVEAYALYKRSWVVIFELGAILLVFGAVMFFGAIAVFLIAAIPLFLLLASAALLGWWPVVWIGIGLGFLLFLALMIAAGTFTISFQYAVWTRLYRRLNEGHVFAKFTRWLRHLIGHEAPNRT